MPLSSVVGAQSIVKPGVCTSSTRPASPFEGQMIYETDTDAVKVWDGSAWVGAVNAASLNGVGATATAYTPTVSAINGTFTTASAIGKYILVNKLCFVQFVITITTNGTAATGVLVSLPFSAVTGYGNTAFGVCRDTAVTGHLSQVMSYTTSAAAILKYDNGYPGGTGYVLNGSFTYEVA